MVAIGSDENGKFHLIYAEGESRDGWIPEMGNTVTRGYFGKDVSKFVRDWSCSGATHHASLAIGHCGHMVEKFGKLIDMDVMRIGS
jgi:L-arabinose isomerase